MEIIKKRNLLNRSCKLLCASNPIEKLLDEESARQPPQLGWFGWTL